VNYRVLVIDEDETLTKYIKSNLEQDNYIVNIAYNGQQALKNIDESIYNLIITNTNLTRVDGLTVLRKIREKSHVPVILMSENCSEEDKVKGFELGADDYVIKPIKIQEFRARIKALIRRAYEYVSSKNDIINVRNIVIDIASRKVNIAGRHVELTSKEYDILFLLVTNPGKIYNRETLLEIIWGYDYYGDSRTVDVHVRRLREKIERDPANPQYIMTKWGVGYYYKG
jgi:DNA-binding response OmpR family regulator